MAKIEGASRAAGQKAATAALQIQNKEKSRSHQEGDGDEKDEEDEDNLEDDDDDSDDDAGDDAGDDAHNHPPSTSRNRKEAVTAADTALATAREQPLKPRRGSSRSERRLRARKRRARRRRLQSRGLLRWLWIAKMRRSTIKKARMTSPTMVLTAIRRSHHSHAADPYGI